jgi:OOP family OmpA-OmpF porin
MKPSIRRLALCSALLLSLPLAAQAREPGSFDDRWYITAGAGANNQDSDRDTENASFGTVGVGKFVNPNWSVDAELNYQNPKANRDEDLNFSQYGISVDARRHFRKEGRRINPYIVGGVGYQRAEEEFDAFPNPNSPGVDKRGYATAKLGFGAQADFQRVSLRGEIAARHSFDSDSLVAPGESGFTDTLASLSIVVPLGAERSVAVKPAPIIAQVDTCSDMDDDGDGVNNCVDTCPNSVAGQTIGEEGCPVALTIDLRGVNFDFNRDTLRSDSMVILDETILILERHPELRVEVAGHTDSIGSEAYNQGLSERRARTVYQYLIEQGIDASRLAGPNGYGETQPIAPNTHEDGSDNPEGRARNRRTDLNVQN